jgi:hypothetical protein
MLLLDKRTSRAAARDRRDPTVKKKKIQIKNIALSSKDSAMF